MDQTRKRRVGTKRFAPLVFYGPSRDWSAKIGIFIGLQPHDSSFTPHSHGVTVALVTLERISNGRAECTLNEIGSSARSDGDGRES
jgi:hypothetical protein